MFFLCLTLEVYDWERILDMWKIRAASIWFCVEIIESFIVSRICPGHFDFYSFFCVWAVAVAYNPKHSQMTPV